VEKDLENKSDIVSFLKTNLSRKSVLKSFIFGSLAQGKTNPSDCDLLIVTCFRPDTKEWDDFIFEINDLKLRFMKRFDLELNTLINTEIEFDEDSALKTRILNKKIIVII
jgi:predicted nucleotidyltransferase